MSQRLRKAASTTGSKALDHSQQSEVANRKKQPNPRAILTVTGDDEAQSAIAAAIDLRPDLHSVQYLLSMIHDLKKFAARSGLQRVALILEMAELEARDQIRKPSQ